MSLFVSVEKRFGDFSLAAEFGSESRSLGLFGPSGSGKSTLLKLITGKDVSGSWQWPITIIRMIKAPSFLI